VSDKEDSDLKFDGVADGPILFIQTRSDVVVFSLLVDSDDEAIKVGFIHKGTTFGVSINYTFIDLSNWHNIIISFDGRLVTLYVDCEKVGERVIMEPDYCLQPDLKLVIGANPQKTKFFMVGIYMCYVECYIWPLKCLSHMEVGV